MRTIYSIGIYGTLNKATVIDENYTIPGGEEGFLCKADIGYEFFIRKMNYSDFWADTEKEAWELYIKYLDSSYEETLEEIQDLEKRRDEILEEKKVVQERIIAFSS